MNKLVKPRTAIASLITRHQSRAPRGHDLFWEADGQPIMNYICPFCEGFGSVWNTEKEMENQEHYEQIRKVGVVGFESVYQYNCKYCASNGVSPIPLADLR